MAEPEILWHYTKADALGCVLHENRILATMADYLNDRSEFVHAFDFYFDEKSLTPDFEESQFPFIFSLSEQGDLLSQWRAYAYPKGVAIGFDKKELDAIATNSNMNLMDCVYDEGDKKRILEKIPPSMSLGVSFGDNQQLINPNLMLNAAKFKHEGFREEREWRIISDVIGVPIEPSEYWFRAEGPIPKKEIKLQDGASLPITEVRLSPGWNEKKRH